MSLINPFAKVRYLLTPDTELQSVGGETKIPYEADYDFYLERLFKHSAWAIDTVDFFNTQVFSNKKEQDLSTKQTAPSAPAPTWDANFLDDLDNGKPMSTTTSGAPNAGDSASGQPGPGLSPSSASHSPTHSPAQSPGYSYPHSPIRRSPSPLPAPHSPLPLPAHPSTPSSPSYADTSQVTTSNSMVSIHNHPGATLSSVSRLQVEVGQMSISGTSDPRPERITAQTALTSGSRWVSSARAPVPVHVPDLSTPPAGSEPLVQKCTTRSHAKTKK